MRSSVTVQSGLLARLADQGIGMVLIGGWNGTKLASIQGASHNDAARRIGQSRCYAAAAWRRHWSRRLVLAKIQGRAG